MQRAVFGVEAGEIFGLLGPNSAGMTTIMDIAGAADRMVRSYSGAP